MQQRSYHCDGTADGIGKVLDRRSVPAKSHLSTELQRAKGRKSVSGEPGFSACQCCFVSFSYLSVRGSCTKGAELT